MATVDDREMPPPLEGPTKPKKRQRKLRARQGTRRAWGRTVYEVLWWTEPDRQPAQTGRWRGFITGHALPLVLYGLLAIGVTFPLIRYFGTRLPSDGGDALQNYWNYWWVGEALRAGHNPYHTDLLYAPYGAPLYLHTLNLFNGLVALPMQLLFGLIPAYNVVVLLSLTLAGYFAYLLVSQISGNRVAGFIGGVIYAFGSYHLAHLLGHMNLLASEWLPAYLLCLILALEARGRRRTLLVVAAAGALCVAMLCEWQYVIFAIVATGWLAGYETLRKRTIQPLVIAATIGGVWVVLAAPLLLPTIAQARQGIDSLVGVTGEEIARGATLLPDEGAAFRLSADPISFVVPGPRQSWWGMAAERLGGRAIAPVGERTLFLGYLPLVLAGIGLWRERRRSGMWLGLGLIAFVLALGPTLQFLGEPVFIGGQEVPLPFRLLQALPGIGLVRVPARYGLLVTLGLAVLAGIGLASVQRPLGQRVGRRWQLGLAAALVALLIAEQITVPVSLAAPTAPPFYEQLGRSDEAGAVMEWPYCKQCASTNYYQTIHRHPVIGGYISRRLGYPIRDLPPYADLPPVAQDIFARAEQTEVGRWALRYSGVRWIVLYRNDPALNAETTAQLLARYAESEPFYLDDQTAVYRPLAPGGAITYLAAGYGWYEAEPWLPGRGQMRWFGQHAEVRAWNFNPAVREYTLRFNVWSYTRPRQLDVLLNGTRLGTWQVGDLQELTLPLSLTPGPHRIELRSPDGPISPASLGDGSVDERELGFGVADMALLER